MNVLLVMPWDKRHHRYKGILSMFVSYPPLTLPTIAALIPEELNANIEIYDEITGYKKHFKKKYDVVFISAMSCSCDRAYELAEFFKREGSYIVMGGYHATFMPEEVSKHADTVIKGLAEKAVPQFFKDYLKNKPKKIYDMQNIEPDDYKIPRRDLLPKFKYAPTPTIIANRGCTNNCGFCAISKLNINQPRKVSSVIEELKGLKKKLVIFFDPNFFCNRKYALELMEEMAKLKIRWMGTATINTAFDEELMEAAEKSRCMGLLVGIESMSQKNLNDSNKKFVQLSKVKEAISIMQKHGISVNGCFVLGFDHDTKESLLSLPEQAKELNLNLVRYSVLTPVPNSTLYKKMEEEGRIITHDWFNYSQNKVVFKPKNMTPEELEEIYEKVWKESYTMKSIISRAIHVPTKHFYMKFVCFCINFGFKFLGKDQ